MCSLQENQYNLAVILYLAVFLEHTTSEAYLEQSTRY